MARSGRKDETVNIKIIARRGPKLNQWDTPTPAIGECDCGRHVVLQNPLNNECQCGKNYNLSGNRVKSLDQQRRERFAY